jgi:D-alanyl-D-alanine carboxypeptidase
VTLAPKDPSPADRAALPARPRSVVLALLLAVAAVQLVTGVGQPAPGSVEPRPGPLSTATFGSGASPRASIPGGSADPGPGGPALAGELEDLVDEPPPGWLTPGEVELLDAQLAAARVLHGIPGVSATIVFSDGTRWTGTAGLADVAKGVPVRPGTPFALGSISKTFTAALILRLIGEGRLALTDGAAAHLSGLPGGSIDPRITIAHLLDHTSGIPDFFLNQRIERAFAADPDARWTASRAFSYVGRPRSAPGDRFVYSNTNFLLLGLIAERVGGQPLATQLRERFWTPLELRTVSFQGTDSPFVPLARGYRFSTDSVAEPPMAVQGTTEIVPFRAAVTASGGAGSIAASSTDVASWARALYSGSVLGPLLTAAMIADAARPTAIDPARPYGYGIYVLPVDGRPTVGHSGRYLGVRSVVRHFPLDGLTIAVLTNQSRTDPGLVLIDLLRSAMQAQADAPPGDGEW